MSDQSKHTPLDSEKLQSNNGVTLQVQKKKTEKSASVLQEAKETSGFWIFW